MIKIFFKTYGCQANVADSEGLMNYLQDLGCCKAEAENEADVIIINSCAVRAKAEQKMFSYLGELAAIKKQRPYIRLGVIGCVASYKKAEIYGRYDHVNFVFGAKEEVGALQSYLFDMITSLQTTKQLYLESPTTFVNRIGQDRDIKKIVEEKELNKKVSKEKVVQTVLGASLGGSQKEVKRSFINIMSGCNNYCSFCIVPFTRGREKSYSIESILERASKDISAGAKEITLIGQNVNSYQDPQTGEKFSALLEKIAQIDGEFWIRYISPHPKDITIDVLETMAKYSSKIANWVHLPLQAGSDPILKIMNRTYSVERYMEVVEWIWKLLPDATITTDIIVGFPSENEEDFQGTLSVMDKVQYDHIYSFVYSKRKYTKAFSMEETCTAEEKQRRLSILQAKQINICLKRNVRHLDKIMKVLVEKRLTPATLLARTSGNLRVNLNGGSDELIGKFVDVKITNAGPANLEASLT